MSSKKIFNKKIKTKKILEETVLSLSKKNNAVLLSGGLDSAIIAKILKNNNKNFVSYFSFVDINSKPKDSFFAKKLSKELNTKLVINKVSLKQLEKELPLLIKIVNDSNPVKIGVASTIFFALKKVTEKKVFVGLGADELFAGYNIFKKNDNTNSICKQKTISLFKNELIYFNKLAIETKTELLFPFLEKSFVRIALTLPKKEKILFDNNFFTNKVFLRNFATELGLSKGFAFRPKLAAQYGSNFDKAIQLLAKKNGFKTKTDYLNNLKQIIDSGKTIDSDKIVDSDKTIDSGKTIDSDKIVGSDKTIDSGKTINSINNLVNNSVSNSVSNLVNNSVNNSTNNSINNPINNLINSSINNPINNLINNLINSSINNSINNSTSNLINISALLSTGKDSIFALCLMQKKGFFVNSLITIDSQNKDSFMFHTPTISLAKLQAIAMNKPLIIIKTKGVKEKELIDLEKALITAIKKYQIKGVCSGAVLSNYQKKRVDKICSKLDLTHFAPLWKTNQKNYLIQLIENDFKIMITRIAGFGLNEKWLGKTLSKQDVLELEKLEKKFGLNIVGEGGEYETIVLDAPIFTKKICLDFEKKMLNDFTGELIIKKAVLKKK